MTLKNLSVQYKVLILGLVPLFVALSFIYLYIDGLIELTEDTAIMDDNVKLMDATSNLIGRLQKERGRTALFLSGGTPLGDVRQFRAATDTELQAWKQALLDEQVRNRAAVDQTQTLPQRLDALRDRYSTPSASQVPEQVRKYTELVTDLIELQSATAKSRTNLGYGKVMSSVVILEEARENAGRLRANMASLLSLDQPLSNQQLQTVLELKANLASNLASRAIKMPPKITEQLEQIQRSAATKQVDLFFNQVIARAAQGNFGIDSERFWEAISAQIEEVSGITKTAVTHLATEIPKDHKAAQQSLIWASISVVILVLVLVSFSFWVAHSITQPIRLTTTRLKDIAEGEGDLTKRLEVVSRDELGRMAEYFNQFVIKLQGVISQIDTNTHTVASAATELATVSNQSAHSVEEMSSRTATVAAAAEEASANSGSVAAAMEQATNSLSSVASATEQMSATIGEIAASSEKARTISTDAGTQASEVSQLMHQLGQAAQEIGQVTETITDISSQTNLLALNATIEAARAGSAGKGFAVVANEIKELAKQTAAATEDIKLKISGVQNSTGSVVTDIEKITGVIGEIGHIVSSIATAIEEQASVTQDVAMNIAQASEGVRMANDQVAEISSVSGSIAEDLAGVSNATNEIRSGGEQVKESSQELSRLAEQLQALVKQFVV